MAISDKGFVDKINSCLNRSLSNIENAQIADSIPKVSSYKIDSVATFAALPPAFENTGRMIFVVSEDVYYFSDGITWTRNLSSNIVKTLYTWGGSPCGALGNGTTSSRSSPVSILGGITDWAKISSGYNTVLGLRSNGILLSWGSNTCGQLGDGTIAAKCSPVSVVGNFSWCEISSGGGFSIGIRNNGTLWSWGSSTCGHLGDGTTVGKCSPVAVCGGFTDWCQVDAGFRAVVAIRTNGTLWAWGENDSGQLGNNSTTARCSPTSVIGGFTDWCQASISEDTVAAVRTNGTLWAWGRNGFGQLGDDSILDKSSPVSVRGGFTDWCQVSVGFEHTAALRQNGTLWSWGRNHCGQLGNGTTSNRSSPVSVVGGFTDWCQLSVGKEHTTALRTNGTIWSWGCNSRGNLGDNSVTDKSSPVSVVGGFTKWNNVQSGECVSVGILFEKGGF